MRTLPLVSQISKGAAPVKNQRCIGAIVLCSALAACGGGGGGGTPPPATIHQVTLNWTASRESGVNSPGGGYQVSISGQPTIDVPYASVPTAPTTIDTSLFTGVYTVTVRAYAALDAAGGSTGSFSTGQSIAVTVP